MIAGRLIVLALVPTLACGADRVPPPVSTNAPQPTGQTQGRDDTRGRDNTQEVLVSRGEASLASCAQGARFLDLWADLDESEHETLANADDLSLALQARWEISRHLSPGVGDAPRALDAAGVARFIAFFGQRVGVDPPAWWADTLQRGSWHPSTGATSYAGVPELLSAAYADETVASSSVGSGRVLMPFEPGDGGGAEVMRRYEGERQIWETRVCAGGRTMLGGLGTEMIKLVLAGELVLAFGAESHAVWVDALRIDDGSLAWRFNSDLWFARHFRRAP